MTKTKTSSNFRPPRPRRGSRRGTMYAIVLLTSLLVATIGVSALQLVRLQSRTATDHNDFAAARTYARSALDIGLLKILKDPNWRQNLGNGNWITNQPIDAGTYSVVAEDPIDANIAQGDEHPVVLTGIGMKGNATFKIATRLEVGPRTDSCLDVSMTSGHDTLINKSTLTSDQWISANNKVDARNGSTIYADVEATADIKGTTYTKTTRITNRKREMPDSATALDYYLTNGTAIPYSALELWAGGTEIVGNGGFETNTSGWSATGFCFPQRSDEQSKNGKYSMKVRFRLSTNAVMETKLPVASFKRGNTYRLSMPLFASTTGTVQGVLTLESTGGVQTFTTPTFNVGPDAGGKYHWVNILGDIVPTWSGDLTDVTLSTVTSFRNDYYLDTVSVTDVTFTPGQYIIDGKLFSPSSNPYGTANARGIYVINCGNKNVALTRSRVVGTLVFIDAGSATTIGGEVSFEPAIYNYPALLSNKKITIKLGSGTLAESFVGINFNPTGTPYPYLGGAVNTSLTESYPSKITGLVYGSDKLAFTSASSVVGVVIANRDIEADTAAVNLNYSNIYLNDPPPGFDIGSYTMQVVPGSWQRSIE